MLSVKSFHESFYGTPTVDETRRRRGKKRHPVAKEEPQNEVAVTGIHYRSFDDDSMAAFVNSATALVPWNGDSKLLIDRYDVRHLLQDLTGIRRRRARPPSPDATKEELDYERYRDVEGLENPSPPEDDQLKDENATGGGYQRVGFDYSTGGDQPTQKERVDEAVFSPPFFVPEHLRMKILKMGPGCGVLKSVSLLQADERGNVQPTSAKVHQIMAGTAKYVIEHGGQVEIVLRVKQAHNPTFGFLMPDHYDHEYFRFLAAHPEHVGIGASSQPVVAEVAVAASSEEAAGGLSLLGTAYGDADEDEVEDDGEGGVSVDLSQKEQTVATSEIPESLDDGPKQQIDCDSVNGTTSKKSSTSNQTATDGAENATIDTGDSHDLSLGSGLPGSTSHEEASEVRVAGKVDTSSGLQEPAPPGMEVSVSERLEACSSSGEHDHQVPPYKEPPLQLRRIIDKMVEFISRNGKEFEAIVRERDKTDHRFPFFLPWNEYYPYYSQELEAARQVHISSEAAVGVPSTSESPNAMEGKVAGKDPGHDSFLKGVPLWEEPWTVGSNGGNAEGGVSDMQACETDKSHTGEGGMGFDAVLAAVRVATRGRPRAVEGGEETDVAKVSEGSERPEMGSDEAVLAAIRAATKRTKLDSSGSGGKGEIVQVEVSSGAPVSTSRDPVKTATTPPVVSAEAPADAEGGDGGVADVVGKAAGVAASEDGDLQEPELAPPEKRKAERLKKAKLFAAMIKDRNGYVTNPGQVSELLGMSVPTLDRVNSAGVAMESTSVKAGDGIIRTGSVVEPESREQTGETQVEAGHEADKGLMGSGEKERKHKEKSKEAEEKQWRVHHKRKMDSDENDGRHSPPERGEGRKDKHHDHYQEGKKKDRRHDHELEGKGKGSTRQVSEGKMKEKVGAQVIEDGGKEYEEVRKDRSHKVHDSDRKRKESRYGREGEQQKIGSRHGHDSEVAHKESRHGRDSDEKRREGRHKHDIDHKRKDDRYRYDSDEKRSGGRYGHDSDERRKERSHRHGKRRKHKDTLDESDGRDGKRDEHRVKKSRRHGEDTLIERESTHQGDLMDGRRLGDAVSMNLDPSGGMGEEKPGLKSVDVPDDIRAKVRAMLAMM